MLNTSTILAIAKMGNTDEIIELCRKALLEEAAKEKGGNSLMRRTKTALRMFDGLEERQYPICGAVIKELPDGSICQCFANGFMAFTLIEPIDGLPAGDNEKALDVCKFIYEAEVRKLDMQETEIDSAAIKAHIKEHKATTKGKRKPPAIYNLGKCYYNAQYILDACAILGGDVKFYQDENNPIKCALLESENGKAIVLPVSPPKKAERSA